jgi:hypothetical protein
MKTTRNPTFHLPGRRSLRWSLLVVTTAIALLVGGFHQWSAQADAKGGETCGGSVSSINWYYDGSSQSFQMNTHWACGDQKKFTFEMQRTTDGGNHWNDYCCDYYHVSGPTCNDGCNKWLVIPAVLCNPSGSYRARYWWADGDLATTSRGAGVVC